MAKNTDIKGVFEMHGGILKYYKKDYNGAIQLINKGVNQFLKSKLRTSYGNHNVIDGYRFFGKSHIALGQQEIGLMYFKKIDSITKIADYLISVSRPVYPEIIAYYKSVKDNSNQLYYINRLLHNDSIFHARYRSTSDKLNKEFDTPILISQKENIIKELETKNNRSYFIIFISFLLMSGITIILLRSYSKNKQHKKRFDNLMQEIKKENNSVNRKINKNNSSIGIAEDVVEIILKGLDEFEKTNGFLEINITSSLLAQKMNTNSKYLTKVIKFHRDKSFSPYINDLRIDYIVQRLKVDKKLQKYTIKALATEAGFNSPEVFSKYFHKKTGIYPSYFIKRIQSQRIDI